LTEIERTVGLPKGMITYLDKRDPREKNRGSRERKKEGKSGGIRGGTRVHRKGERTLELEKRSTYPSSITSPPNGDEKKSQGGVAKK